MFRTGCIPHLALVALLLLTICANYESRAQTPQNDSTAMTHLPDTWDNIHLGAIGGIYQPVNGLDASPLVGFVMWGNLPDLYLTNVVNHARYCKWGQATAPDPTIDWFKQNHPDWLSYTSDRKTLAYYRFGNLVDYIHAPLDFTNPAVQDLIIGQCLIPALSQGFTAVGFDHVTTLNSFAVAGHYTTKGQWVQMFSGKLSDQTYRHAMISAYANLTSKMKTVAQQQGKTIAIAFNAYPNLDYNDHYTDLLPYADIILDEAGFTRLGNTISPYLTASPVSGTNITNAWFTKIQDLLILQNKFGKPLVLNGLVPYAVDATHLPKQRDIQWILANYLLVKSHYTYCSFISSVLDRYIQLNVSLPEYFALVGYPLGAIYQSQNVYMRTYSTGMTIVNPSPGQAYSVTLPANTYKDLYGHAITTVTMQPYSGLVLVKK
ncbi:MAG TPA: hypothetical protein VKR83_18040 [Ktedonobacteraceae bacterium]|nr:hypothetical protein [Ktedonobacteraceae bacterium]